MSNRKRMISDLLFWFQIIAAGVFSIPYALRVLVDLRGVSIAQFGLVLGFVIFHLALAHGAHRVQPSRITCQTIGIFWMWAFLISSMIIATLLNGGYQWSIQDTTSMVMALVFTLGIIIIASMANWGLTDPRIKGLLAITYKAVPQLILSWQVWGEGGSGIPGVSIWIGHLTIALRLGQNYFMVREAGWDRNRVWLAISEAANELSWVIVTIAWLMW